MENNDKRLSSSAFNSWKYAYNFLIWIITGLVGLWLVRPDGIFSFLLFLAFWGLLGNQTMYWIARLMLKFRG